MPALIEGLTIIFPGNFRTQESPRIMVTVSKDYCAREWGVKTQSVTEDQKKHGETVSQFQGEVQKETAGWGARHVT